MRIGRGEPALFASDVHLAGDAPRTARWFFDSLDTLGRDAAHVFLLGDLFEMWVGDDGADPLADTLGGLLSGLVRRGTRVWLMRGNRDFLLDVALPAPAPGVESFSARCSATLLDDPCVIELHGAATVLTHGDALCTDDAVYQQWRRTCRDPIWQQGFLHRPLAERLAIARGLRTASEAGKREMPQYLMDVNPTAIDTLLQASGAERMIHGHTHRPARHDWVVGGSTRTRWVLPDWDADARRGGWLRWADAQGATIDPGQPG